jgi:hypothetical protein
VTVEKLMSLKESGLIWIDFKDKSCRQIFSQNISLKKLALAPVDRP